MSSDDRNESNVTIFTDNSVNIPELVLDPKYLQPIRLRIFQEDGSLRAKKGALLKPTSPVGEAGVKEEALVLPLGSPSATPPPLAPALKASTSYSEVDVGKENIMPAQVDTAPVPMRPTGTMMQSPRHSVGKRKKRTTLQMLGLEDDEDNAGYCEGVRGMFSAPPAGSKRARVVSREGLIKKEQEEIQ